MKPKHDPARTAHLTAIIDAGLKRLNIKSQRASIAATGKRDAIRDIRRGVMPRADRWCMICDYLGVDAHGLVQPDPVTVLTQTDPLPLFSPSPSRDLPLWTGKGGRMDAKGQPEAVTLIPRPAALVGRSLAYAAYVTDENNAPILRPGHILYMDPSRPAAIGDLVRVILTDGAAMVGIMLDNDARGVTLRGAAEAKSHTLASKRVDAVDFVAMHSRIAE